MLTTRGSLSPEISHFQSAMKAAVIFLATMSAAAASSCPDKTCHSGGIDGAEERTLTAPSRLSGISDFRLEPTLADLLNKQANLELQAFYTYLSMTHYFERDDVALPGFQKFFKEASDEELGHATRLMSYLNQRGTPVTFGDVVNPCDNELLEGDTEGEPGRHCESVGAKIRSKTSSRPPVSGQVQCDWHSPLSAVAAARQLELNVWRQLKIVHHQAAKLDDINTANLIEEYLDEGSSSVKAMSDLLTRLRRAEPCLGHHIIDQELQK